MAKYLIVNADDFGLTSGVNQGIITSFKNGIVTSTTLMVNMPGFKSAVELAHQFPELAVGLHLNLTYGVPLSPPEMIPSIVDHEGRFTKNHIEKIKNEANRNEIEKELRAQLDRFLNTGLPLSHIDTHHHLHQSERILNLVSAIALEFHVPVRCLQEDALIQRGIPSSARFVNFFGDQEGVQRLLRIIDNLSDGFTEIPCHPGRVDEELIALSTLTYIRELELRAITDPRVVKAVQSAGITLTNYHQLKRGH